MWVGAGHRSETGTPKKSRKQGWRVCATKVGASSAPAREGATSGPQNASQRPAKQKTSLPIPPHASPAKNKARNRFANSEVPCGGGEQAGGTPPPQPGLDRGEFPNPPEDPPLPTVVRGGAGPLRRAGRRLPFLWVGSSPAAQPPTPPPQAAEKSPGWKKEQRVYLHAPAFLPLGS